MAFHHYVQAIKCCDDALSRISSQSDPVMFDVLGALKAIAQGIQDDLRDLERKLDSVERKIR